MVEYDVFADLDKARMRQRHSPERACSEIGVCLATWYNWSHGTRPRFLQLRAVREYIERSKRRYNHG